MDIVLRKEDSVSNQSEYLKREYGIRSTPLPIKIGAAIILLALLVTFIVAVVSW